MYKIEKNIPLPRPYQNSKKEMMYPLKELEVGDSFFVRAKLIGERDRIVRTLRLQKIKCGIRIATKKYEDGVRCWRIE